MSELIEPTKNFQISNEVITELLKLSHNNVKWVHLYYAQQTFNYRQLNDKRSWLDLILVYVGLPDWIETQDELKAYDLPYVEVPMGLLDDLFDSSSIEMNFAIPYQGKIRKVGKLHNLLAHTDVLTFINRSTNLNSDIYKTKGIFESKHHYYEKYLLNVEENCEEKKLFVIDLIREDKAEEEAGELFWTAMSYAYGLSIGRNELLDFFKTKYSTSLSKEEAEAYFSHLTIDEFYKWSCNYFAMDRYVSLIELEETRDEIINNTTKFAQTFSDVFKYAKQIMKRSKVLH